MNIEIKQDDATLIHLILSGRLDTVAAQEAEVGFKAQVLARRKNTIIDLAGLTFLASYGIRLLLMAAKDLNAIGYKLVLVNVPPLAAKAISASGLDLVMPMAPNLASAQALFQKNKD